MARLNKGNSLFSDSLFAEITEEEKIDDTNDNQGPTEFRGENIYSERDDFSFIKRPRKIAGGGVLQYPIDLDTDIQDYFEIQIFKYRAAKRLPRINEDNENPASGFYARSNLRGLRQNQRLEELQSTIQLPIPNSVKDQNSVGWGGGEMSSVAGSILGPVTDVLFNQGGMNEEQIKRTKDLREAIKRGAETTVGAINTIGDIFGGLGDVLKEKAVRRRNMLSMMNSLTRGIGVNINVNNAISRFGAVENPNLELLITGPALRSFSFTIRLTPRSPEESKKVRMIIRALKQSMAIKKGQQLFEGGSRGLLLGTPDVYKLRYIKARTQNDIKGLNKFKTCALQNMSVDYTGEAGRFAAYDDDSQPVTSIITLSFSELVPIYDTDYVEFAREDDNVGL